MSAASARAALIDLASTWRRCGMDVAGQPTAMVYVECAGQLDRTTIEHLSNDPTADQWARTQLRQAVSVLAAAMASEGIPAAQRERVVNTVLHGHPDGVEAARITGRTTERLDSE